MLTLILETGLGGEVERRFEQPLVTIGRGSGADLRIADSRVSSLHGEIALAGGEYRYRDLRSTNGSMVRRKGKRMVVDGVKVPEVVLRDMDEILLGDASDPVVIMVRIDAEPSLEAKTMPTETVIANRAVADLPALASGMDRKALSSLLEFMEEAAGLNDFNAVLNHLVSFLANNLSAPMRALAVIPREGRSGGLELVLDMPLAIGGNEVKNVSIRLLEGYLRSVSDISGVSLWESDSSLGGKVLCIPLSRSRTGESASGLLAAVFMVSSVKSGFDEADLKLASAMGKYAAGILEKLDLVERLAEAEARLEARCEHLASKLDQAGESAEILGESPELEDVLRQARAVAPTSATVLILGETGTGKELLARKIHEWSPRAGSIFAAVNCGAIPAGLIESELFGHLKGSFTGAFKDKKGMFEIAHGGTLFLDEVGELPKELQVKLLRAIQEGEVLPVGATQPRPVDVRVIAATNKDLQQAVARGEFRQDLYYRLNVFPITLPPLRERRDDAVVLARRHLERMEERYGKGIKGLSKAVERAFASYEWPGNVRELFNEVERGYLLAEPGGFIDVSELSPALVSVISGKEQNAGEPKTLKQRLEAFEREIIEGVLARHGGNRTHAAKELGISRQALIIKINKLGL